MYRIAFLLLSSVLLLNCGDDANRVQQLPYYNEPDFTPIFLEENTPPASKITHTITDFSFLDQDSTLISEKSIAGKIHVASFIFTSCVSICPTMTKNLKLVNDQFEQDNDVLLLSFSVTPWIDNPQKLKVYKQANGIKNPNWHFLTGNKAAIYSLARTAYFAEEDIGFTKDSTEFLHTEHILLVDKTKRIRGIYNGTLALEMQQLIEDIRLLEKEH